jgi:hypothetical protein
MYDRALDHAENLLKANKPEQAHEIISAERMLYMLSTILKGVETEYVSHNGHVNSWVKVEDLATARFQISYRPRQRERERKEAGQSERGSLEPGSHGGIEENVNSGLNAPYFPFIAFD